MTEPCEENFYDLLPVHHYAGTIYMPPPQDELTDLLILVAILILP